MDINSEVVAAVEGAWMVGGVRADIGDVKYFGSSGSTYILVVDVGFVPMYWKDVGRVPPSGGTDTDE